MDASKFRVPKAICLKIAVTLMDSPGMPNLARIQFDAVAADSSKLPVLPALPTARRTARWFVANEQFFSSRRRKPRAAAVNLAIVDRRAPSQDRACRCCL
jgi:hypothetical protein